MMPSGQTVPSRSTILTVVLLSMSLSLVLSCTTARPSSDPVIRVGIDHAPPYQSIRAGGGVEGLSVDMLGEAARRIGVRVHWVPSRMLPDEAFRAGLVDLWPAAAS